MPAFHRIYILLVIGRLISPNAGERMFHSRITGGKAEQIHVDADGFIDLRWKDKVVLRFCESQLGMKIGDWC